MRQSTKTKQVWIGACPEVIGAIIKAKTESWEGLPQDAISNSEGPSMWKVIQDLNGTPHSNLPNEAMSHNGRTITSIKSKANVFIHHYARVGKMNMLRVNQNLNHQFKKCLNEPSADAPRQMAELLSATQKIKCKGVAGSDNIPPSFLKSLSPLALQELLSTLHSSFSSAHCPRIWRVGIIIPLLKAGKSPSEVTSFHSISLTSHVVKLLECLC